MKRTYSLLFAASMLTLSFAGPADDVREPLMGTPEDIAYAGRLWSAMAAEGLVGEKLEAGEPFFGGAEPHGRILEVLPRTITVGDHRGFVVVKRNYAGPGVSESAVARDRMRFLKALTVMFRRERGYDPDNLDWFWVKYRPDGTLFEATVAGKPRLLAGRIVKGRTPEENGGCLWCHRSAGGGDYIFYPWIKLPE